MLWRRFPLPSAPLLPLTLSKAAQANQAASHPCMQVGWAFWPAANLVNFVLVPPTHRVLFANAAGLFWNAVLSWENSTKGRVAAAVGGEAARGVATAAAAGSDSGKQKGA